MSDPVPYVDSDDQRKQLLAQHGQPAFVRRARAVQDSFEDVVSHCRARRDELLSMVKLRLATLAALAGDWTRLRPLVADDDQVELLRQLHQELRPKLLGPLEVTGSAGRLRAALQELVESLERFNRRWAEYLATVDLTRVNEVRENYNRYFVLEKECAVGRAGMSKADYLKLPPLGTDAVASRLPPLRLPRPAESGRHGKEELGP